MNSSFSPTAFLKKWFLGLVMVLGVTLLLGLCVLDDVPLEGGGVSAAPVMTPSVLLGEMPAAVTQSSPQKDQEQTESVKDEGKQMNPKQAEVKLAKFFEIVVVPMAVFVIVCTVARARMGKQE